MLSVQHLGDLYTVPFLVGGLGLHISSKHSRWLQGLIIPLQSVICQQRRRSHLSSVSKWWVWGFLQMNDLQSQMEASHWALLWTDHFPCIPVATPPAPCLWNATAPWFRPTAGSTTWRLPWLQCKLHQHMQIVSLAENLNAAIPQHN